MDAVREEASILSRLKAKYYAFSARTEDGPEGSITSPRK
jgi:hypothetical protein